MGMKFNTYTNKVGNFPKVPYQRYTGILIGKMILPVQQPKIRMSLLKHDLQNSLPL